MTTQRKAFIDPFWAIIAGLVLATAAVIAFFIADAKYSAAYAQIAPCKPVRMIVSDALDEKAEVRRVTDPEEVARAVTLISEGGGSAMANADTVIYSIFRQRAQVEIVFASGEMACGYNFADMKSGRAFWRYIKNVIGDPA